MADEMTPNQQKPRIIVDEDWKAQAEVEKQRLAEQEDAAQERGAAGGEARQLPQASFTTLVSGLTTQVLFSLGAVPDPATGQRYRDLDLAKHHIDTLGVLEEKTRGNLSAEEKKLLDSALYECRMAYVRVAQGGM